MLNSEQILKTQEWLKTEMHLDLPMKMMTLPRRLRMKLLLKAVDQKRKLKHYISVLKSSL